MDEVGKMGGRWIKGQLGWVPGTGVGLLPRGDRNRGRKTLVARTQVKRITGRKNSRGPIMALITSLTKKKGGIPEKDWFEKGCAKKKGKGRGKMLFHGCSVRTIGGPSQTPLGKAHCEKKGEVGAEPTKRPKCLTNRHDCVERN